MAMKKSANKKSESETLRELAENLYKKRTVNENIQLSGVDALKLIHELQVHQIELELQNEELILARSAAKDAADKYIELFDFAPIGYFILSKEGQIIQLNFTRSSDAG